MLYFDNCNKTYLFICTLTQHTSNKYTYKLCLYLWSLFVAYYFNLVCVFVCLFVCVNMCLFKAPPYSVTNQVKYPNSEQKIDGKALLVEKCCTVVKKNTVNTKHKMKKKNKGVNLVQKATKIFDTAEIGKTCKSQIIYIYIQITSYLLLKLITIVLFSL